MESAPRKGNIAEHVRDWSPAKHKGESLRVIFPEACFVPCCFEYSMVVGHKQWLLRNERKHIRQKC